MQHECIPQAILGMDVICQAKSGMGKTAVFVISSLQQLEPVDGQARWARQQRRVGMQVHTNAAGSQLTANGWQCSWFQHWSMLRGHYIHAAPCGVFYWAADWAVPPPPCCLAQVSVVVLCHTRELAFQICHEYER